MLKEILKEILMSSSFWMFVVLCVMGFAFRIWRFFDN